MHSQRKRTRELARRIDGRTKRTQEGFSIDLMMLLLGVISNFAVGLILKGLRQGSSKRGWPNYQIQGKVIVNDGDTIRVARRSIRISGLDAPEIDQSAKNQQGNWIPHGRIVSKPTEHFLPNSLASH